MTDPITELVEAAKIAQQAERMMRDASQNPECRDHLKQSVGEWMKAQTRYIAACRPDTILSMWERVINAEDTNRLLALHVTDLEAKNATL